MSGPVPPPDEPVEALAPEEGPLPDSLRRGFPCANCGAETTWDPDADALVCGHCGEARPVPRAEGTIVERPLSAAGDAARGLGLAVRVARCGTCGARISFDSAATSRQCVYCGSSSVLEQEENRNALRPESLVPLDIGRAKAEESFRRWLRGLWFRPGALKRAQAFEAVGVYVPFWTFDCRVHSDWSADAGHYYYVMEPTWTTVNGRRVMQMRQVRKVRWVPAWGQRDDVFDDLLVHASAGQPKALVQKLGSFDTQGLVPYRPEYLAGWHAEEYQVDLEQAWAEGLARVEERQRSRCAGDVPGDTQRNLRVKNTVSDVRWKHVLLPVWSVAYRYKGKPYAVLVHGQSGHVAGQAPLSWAKILGLVLAVAALLLLALGGAALAGALRG
jgi:DNA-directed RNA polymerase subunit RPC12/RpoP